MTAAELGMGTRGSAVEDDVLAGAMVDPWEVPGVDDGRLEGAGKSVGASPPAGDGVSKAVDALPHPAAKRTSTHAAVHTVQVTRLIL